MENKLNTGAIFKNDKKTSDNQPDYRGTANIDGKEKEIALWLKTSAKGVKYFSVSISEPYKKNVEKTIQVQDETSDLPF